MAVRLEIPPPFSRFVAVHEARALPTGRPVELSHSTTLERQKLLLRAQNLMIERIQARLDGDLPKHAADDQYKRADEYAALIAQGSMSMDEAIQLLIQPQQQQPSRAGSETLENVPGGSTAADSEIEADREEGDGEDGDEGGTRFVPFVAAPTFYSGGAAWRGKKKATGESLPVGTPASALAEHLETLGITRRRNLRPHQSRPEMRFGGSFGMTEREQSRPSFVDRQVIAERGPAAYTPQWHAESSRKASLSAPFTLQPRFPRGGGGPVALPTAGDTVPYVGPRTSLGEQASSMLRSKPIFGFGSASRDHGSAMAGTEAQRRSRPGPGSYNA